MVDLNEVLSKAVDGTYPVIQLSNGLYTSVVAIHPSEESGTNLQITYRTFDELDQIHDVIVIVIGSWDSSYYNFNTETGAWGLNIIER